MINITIQRDGSHEIQSMELRGHAGFAEYGQDIVCAAVSSLSIHTVNTLIGLAHIELDVEVDDVEGGYLRIQLPDTLTEQQQHDAKLLLDGLVQSFVQLQEEHKENITIKESH